MPILFSGDLFSNVPTPPQPLPWKPSVFLLTMWMYFFWVGGVWKLIEGLYFLYKLMPSEIETYLWMQKAKAEEVLGIFSSVQSLSRVWLFVTPWTAAHLSITNSFGAYLKFGAYSNSCPLSHWMPSNHLILCCSLLLLPSIFPSVGVFSNELALHIRWPKQWSFSITPDPSVQFSSVAQSCLTPCNPMNRSMPGLPGHHQLLELTQTHVRWVSDAIQPSHPLSFPSSPAFKLFKWVSSSHQVAKVLEFQLQH